MLHTKIMNKMQFLAKHKSRRSKLNFIADRSSLLRISIILNLRGYFSKNILTSTMDTEIDQYSVYYYDM